MGTTVQSDHHADRSRRERSGEMYRVRSTLGSYRLSPVIRRFPSYSEEERDQREIRHFYPSFECKEQ